MPRKHRVMIQFASATIRLAKIIAITRPQFQGNTFSDSNNVTDLTSRFRFTSIKKSSGHVDHCSKHISLNQLKRISRRSWLLCFPSAERQAQAHESRCGSHQGRKTTRTLLCHPRPCMTAGSLPSETGVCTFHYCLPAGRR